MNARFAKLEASWLRHFLYRKESLKTTWKLRLLVLFLAVLLISLTRGFWSTKIGQSLICKEQIAPSDALLVENFEPEYLVFERAAALQRAGVAPRVFVHIKASRRPDGPNSVSKGFAEVMARIAHLQNMELIPIDEIEPISLNAAMQIRDFLTAEHVKSIVVVTKDFRSRRSAMVYKKVMTPVNISVGCVPAFARTTPQNWTETTHGIQEVMLQFAKLQYYRFYILPLS